MNLRGVILAGGTGSRLLPLTKVTNKHLLPVGGKPMIYHPINKLVEAGIRKIMIVTGTEHAGDFISLLGSGRDWGCEFSYRVQDVPGGIAHALGLAEDFARGSSVVVMLGDNIFGDSLSCYVEAYRKQSYGARILLKYVEQPNRFGIAVVKDQKIEKIVEKPTTDIGSNMAVTGCYFYDDKVFNAINNLKASPRGELEITDINNLYLKYNMLKYDVLPSWWSDAGTHESLQQANLLIG